MYGRETGDRIKTCGCWNLRNKHSNTEMVRSLASSLYCTVVVCVRACVFGHTDDTKIDAENISTLYEVEVGRLYI